MYSIQYNLISSDVVCCFRISVIRTGCRGSYTNELPVLRSRKDGMDDRKREFSFGDILTEAFIVGVLGILQVLKVVSNLEEDSDEID